MGVVRDIARDSSPRFVRQSVGRSHFTFFMIFIFGPHYSIPNGLKTSNMVPAHPQATLVAVYPALFLTIFLVFPHRSWSSTTDLLSSSLTHLVASVDLASCRQKLYVTTAQVYVSTTKRKNGKTKNAFHKLRKSIM